MTDSVSGPDKNLNLYIRGMKPSATVAINERSDALGGRTRHHQVRPRAIPLPVPEVVVQALRDSAHEKDYSGQKVFETQGYRCCISCSATESRIPGDDVLVGPGSKELLFLLQLVFYGDLVILRQRGSHMPTGAHHRTHSSMVPTGHNGWRLQPERLAQLCEEDEGRPSIWSSTTLQT